MKFYLVSDNHDTLLGMRLSGIEGEVVHEKDEIIQAIKKAEEDETIGVILITERLAAMASEYINERKLNSKRALFLEIPDRHGSGRSADSISEYIRDAIGISI